MPHIGVLTLAMAIIEDLIACGLLFLGYGWPTSSAMEDIMKNRIGSLIMFAAMAMWAWPEPIASTAAW